MRQIVIPNNEDHWLEMRCKVLTSTDIASLFGLSPYSTYYETWQRKKNQQYVKLDGNERMRWGTALQDVIAAEVAKDEGWNIRRMNEFIFDDVTRLGSSFDFAIGDDGLAEVKNVDGLVYKSDWIPSDTGAPQSPLHIEIQCQTELMVSERQYLWLIALVGGNRIEKILRTPDIRVQDAIRTRAAEFWKSIDENREPMPNYETDSAFIASMYNFAEPGSIIDIASDDNLTVLANDYKALGDTAKECESKREAIKAQLLQAIGSAEKATGNGFSITAGMVASAEVAYTRSAFRNFRINWKKAK